MVLAAAATFFPLHGASGETEQELRYVEAAGTKTLLIAADPGKVDLLSPAEIEPALKAGRDRAVREADRVKAFWA